MYSFVAASGPHVSLVAERLFSVGPLGVTNSMLLGFVGTSLLLALLIRTATRTKRARYDRLTVAMLWGYELLLNTVEEVIGDQEQARKLAPLGISMFFVIILNNWLGFLPLVGPVTLHGDPLLRGLAADLNFTLALAVITMVTAQIWAIKQRGFVGNLHRYFANPFKQPIEAISGGMEMMAEASRLIALAMRLFGNIFAGEIILVVVAYLSQWASPLTLPIFMGLELFVGAVQAYVFFMLTIVFISLGNKSPEADEPSLIRSPLATVS